MNTKKLTAEEYQKIFDELIKSNILQVKEGTTWTQAYADTPTRKLLPSYWFVCKETAEVISLIDSASPSWLNTSEKSQRNKYMFSYLNEQGIYKHKSIEAHNLNGIVHGSKAWGEAAKLLEEQGIFALGVGKGKVNGHHMNGKDNNADNIEFVKQDTAHDALTHMPGLNSKDKKAINYMVNVLKMVEDEQPEGATVIVGGEDKFIDSPSIESTDTPFIKSLNQVFQNNSFLIKPLKIK